MGRVGAGGQDAARTGALSEGPKRRAHRGDSRFAACQDGAKRGRRGYDAGKKIKGRKRHIAVDTEGNLLAEIVHSAGIQDRVAARAVLMRLFCRLDTITTVFVDGGYTGKRIGWAKEMFGYDVEVVKRKDLHKFEVLPKRWIVVLPKRWIVERTFAWLNWSRRLSKDYELRHTSAETAPYFSRNHDPYRLRAPAAAPLYVVSGQILRPGFGFHPMQSSTYCGCPILRVVVLCEGWEKNLRLAKLLCPKTNLLGHSFFLRNPRQEQMHHRANGMALRTAATDGSAVLLQQVFRHPQTNSGAHIRLRCKECSKCFLQHFRGHAGSVIRQKNPHTCLRSSIGHPLGCMRAQP